MEIPDGYELRDLLTFKGFDPAKAWDGAPALVVKAAEPHGSAPVLAKGNDSLGSRGMWETAEIMFGTETIRAYTNMQNVVVPLRKTTRNSLDEIVVGRSDACDVRIRDQRVSRVHALIKAPSGEDALWRLIYRKCANGTGLNGLPMAPGDTFVMASGDTIQFGTVEAVFLESFEIMPFIQVVAELAIPPVSRIEDDTRTIRRPLDCPTPPEEE